MVGFKSLRFIAVLLVSCLSFHAYADGIPEREGPCGILHQMGSTAKIYNKSDFDWIVSFRTESYSAPFGVFINAGAVKYLQNGLWEDNGTGDYRTAKTYNILVPSQQNVSIAYCSDISRNISTRITGTVSFIPAAPDYANGIPDGNVKFTGLDENSPEFHNQGTTKYVDYNRLDTTAFVIGNLTICPHDSQCNTP